MPEPDTKVKVKVEPHPVDPFADLPLAGSQASLLAQAKEEMKCDTSSVVIGTLHIRFHNSQLWEAVIHHVFNGLTLYQIDKINMKKEKIIVNQRYMFPNKGNKACGIAIDGGSADSSFYLVGPAIDFSKIQFLKAYKIEILATGLPSDTVDIIRDGRLEHPLYYHWSHLEEITTDGTSGSTSSSSN